MFVVLFGGICALDYPHLLVCLCWVLPRVLFVYYSWFCGVVTLILFGFLLFVVCFIVCLLIGLLIVYWLFWNL